MYAHRSSICFVAIVKMVISTLAISAATISRAGNNGISIPLTKHSSSLNVDQRTHLKSHVASYTAKLLHGLDNYERNRGAAHPSALKQSGSSPRALNRIANGLALEFYDAHMWYGNIFIGTPAKLFTVQIDTGSSDLFIPASTGNAVCKTHDHLWDPNEDSSETTEYLDKSFRIKFGDGARVRGDQYAENITIAGFTADKQTFGVATAYSDILKKSCFPPDGLLGLAFPSISRYPATPLLQTLVSEGKLPDGVFSLKLDNNGGEMFVGGVNKELYDGDIMFVNVDQEGFWQVTVDDIRVNGQVVLKSVVSILDTGANYIYGDPDQLLTLHQAHGGKALEDGWYTFPCDDFPEVSFTFGGVSFTIPADDLNLGKVDDHSPDCFSSIVGNLHGQLPFWSIGSPFFQRVYSVFDISHEPPQVGFAHLKEVE